MKERGEKHTGCVSWKREWRLRLSHHASRSAQGNIELVFKVLYPNLKKSINKIVLKKVEIVLQTIR